MEQLGFMANVVFITNGSAGWIKASCTKYLPDLWPAIQKHRLVSAKELCNNYMNTDPFVWKQSAFASEIARFFRYNGSSAEDPKIVISIGDSLHEQAALYDVYTKGIVMNLSIRSVKLISAPSPSQIVLQLKALQQDIYGILHLPWHKIRAAEFRYVFDEGGGKAQQIDDGFRTPTTCCSLSADEDTPLTTATTTTAEERLFAASVILDNLHLAKTTSSSSGANDASGNTFASLLTRVSRSLQNLLFDRLPVFQKPQGAGDLADNNNEPVSQRLTTGADPFLITVWDSMEKDASVIV